MYPWVNALLSFFLRLKQGLEEGSAHWLFVSAFLLCKGFVSLLLLLWGSWSNLGRVISFVVGLHAQYGNLPWGWWSVLLGQWTKWVIPTQGPPLPLAATDWWVQKVPLIQLVCNFQLCQLWGRHEPLWNVEPWCFQGLPKNVASAHKACTACAPVLARLMVWMSRPAGDVLIWVQTDLSYQSMSKVLKYIVYQDDVRILSKEKLGFIDSFMIVETPE